MNGKPLNREKTTSNVLSVLLLIYGFGKESKVAENSLMKEKMTKKFRTVVYEV